MDGWMDGWSVMLLYTDEDEVDDDDDDDMQTRER